MSPRPGAPRKVSDAAVARVLALTLETTPNDATHGSTRAMAARCDLSQSTVSRSGRAFSVQPRRRETFQLWRDPLFIDTVREGVGVYLNPPDKAVVLGVDEKSQLQALDRSQPGLPMRPGQAGRRVHDYTRPGTVSLFAALAAAPPALSRSLPPPPAPPGLNLVERGCGLLPDPADRPGRSPQHPGTHRGHPGLSGHQQRTPPSVCPGQDRRRNPRFRAPVLSTNFGLRTLDGGSAALSWGFAPRSGATGKSAKP